MIPTARHKVPLKLELGSTPLVELASPTYIPSLTPKRRIHAEVGRYTLRFAETAEVRDAAYHLRFPVFNLELGEGLETSYRTGLAMDRFDLCCERLLVEDKCAENPARSTIGT
ncbi:MAG: hypothetical protein ABR987_22185 [Terracidiphilus sp.]